MAKWKVLFYLSEFIFVCDTVVLDANMTLFPLCPNCAYAAASLFISTTVFLNHQKLSINISLKDVVVLNKVSEGGIFEYIQFLSDIIKVVDEISIKKLICVRQRP